MKRLLAALPLLSMIAFAQQVPIQCGSGTGGQPCHVYTVYNGSNIPTAQCWAVSIDFSGRRANNVVTISAASNANPAVMTSTAHGFPVDGSKPQVTIAGFTGNWTPANGTFTATIIDANTFSIAVDSTTFGAKTGTVTFTTTGPRLTVAEWGAKIFGLDGSNNIVGQTWLGGVSSLTNLCTTAALAGNAQ